MDIFSFTLFAQILGFICIVAFFLPRRFALAIWLMAVLAALVVPLVLA